MVNVLCNNQTATFYDTSKPAQVVQEVLVFNLGETIELHAIHRQDTQDYPNHSIIIAVRKY